MQRDLNKKSVDNYNNQHPLDDTHFLHTTMWTKELLFVTLNVPHGIKHDVSNEHYKTYKN